MKSPQPPRAADRLLAIFCAPHLLEAVQGDLHEEFALQVERLGERKARWWYWREVLGFLRPRLDSPFALKRQPNEFSQPFFLHPAMIRNYLKIAWRSLLKNKAASFINLFGLTAGLSSCLLIGLYVQYERSYDTFQPNGSRIARVIMEYSFEGSPESKKGNFTSTKVAPTFARTFPEVETGVRMTDRDLVVRYRDKQFTEPDFLFADSTFLTTFYAPLRLGNPKQALSGPYKVILTETAAKKYFGSQNPMGQILLVGADNVAYQVTGVMADYPANSQIKFDFLASFSSLKANQEETYADANYTTYLLLKNEHLLPALQAKIAPFMRKEMAGSGTSVNFYLEPFDRVHLHSDYAAFVPNTSMAYLYILTAVALLILVIVGFTYINLSTARAIERAREVGIRKVAGAEKRQLFWQFIGESSLACLTALMLSLVIASLALPVFNDITEKQLPVRALFSPTFLGLALLATLLVSLLAGSYPALILTRFKPVTVLKGAFKHSASGRWTQQSLVVFQFAISFFLIVSTVIVQRQLNYIQHKNLGFSRDHVLVLPLPQQLLTLLPTIKQELKANPDIQSVSRCRSTPVNIGSGYAMRSALMAEKESIAVTGNPVDEDYVKTTGLQILAGNDLTEQDVKNVAGDQPGKTHHFILNEQAAKQLGWTPTQAIGKKMFLGDQRPGFVKAVVRDFHFESMHQAIKPLVLFPEHRGGKLLVKISGRQLPETIAFVEEKWKQLVPGVPFEYQFMDDEYTKLYRSERQLGTALKLFAGLAILLACLGLFGLSSYLIQQRTKEIGVRKILGASLLNVLGLLSGNFIKLVLLAIVVASPVAYWLMQQWLQDFVYRIAIEWWVFVAAALVAVGIALLTVSFQSVKAALTNPVKSLRSE